VGFSVLCEAPYSQWRTAMRVLCRCMAKTKVCALQEVVQ
jgi:hypothetical protein